MFICLENGSEIVIDIPDCNRQYTKQASQQHHTVDRESDWKRWEIKEAIGYKRDERSIFIVF